MSSNADAYAAKEQGGQPQDRAAQVEAALAGLVAAVLPGQASGDVLADALVARRALEASIARQQDEDEIATQLAAFRNRLEPLAYITTRGAVYAGSSSAGNRQLCGVDEAVHACGVVLRQWQRGAVPQLDELAAFAVWAATAPAASPFEAWKARGALSAPWRWSEAMHLLAKVRQDGYLSDSMAAQISAHLAESRYEQEKVPQDGYLSDCTSSLRTEQQP